jgi:hypothetical protein
LTPVLEVLLGYLGLDRGLNGRLLAGSGQPGGSAPLDSNAVLGGFESSLLAAEPHVHS